MTYFHVRLTVQGQRHDEVKNDLSEDQLDSQFLTPYRAGETITVNGKTIAIGKIDRIRISKSEEASPTLIARLKAQDRQSPVVVAGRPSYNYRAAASADDVTDEFITGPPGTNERSPASQARASSTDEIVGPGDGVSVFLVAGRDTGAVSAVKAFLRTLSLRVVEWEEASARTGVPNPYVGDVVMTGLRMADTAVVLFTPDDIVRLRPDLVNDDDGSEETALRGQARPNVLYEAGIADALGRERTVLVEAGPVKSFSDISGRLVVRYDGSAVTRKNLADRLATSGLHVDTTGVDWLIDGPIDEPIAKAREALAGGAANQDGNHATIQGGANEAFAAKGARLRTSEDGVEVFAEPLRSEGGSFVANGMVLNNLDFPVSRAASNGRADTLISYQ